MLLKKAKIVIPVVVLSLLLLGCQAAVPTPPAFAYITLEVNPILMLTIDADKNVIGVELRGEQARRVFDGIELSNMTLEQAFGVIAGRLNDAGFLNPENRIFLMVQSAKDANAEKMPELTVQAEQAMAQHIEQLAAKLPVETVAVGASFSGSARQSEVKPSDLAYLAKHGVSAEAVAALRSFTEGLGVGAEAFAKEFHRISEAFLDMVAAGLSVADAMTVLERAALVDPSPKGIYEITSGFIDMQDAGIAFADALKVFDLRQDIAPGIFRREISTIISDMIDMHDVGITAPTAMAVLIMAITADQTLREVSTVASALIDLMEEEPAITEAEALAIIAEAIAADPTLRNFDNLIGNERSTNWPGGRHDRLDQAFRDMVAAGLSEDEARTVLERAALVDPSPKGIYEIASGFINMRDAGIAFADALKVFDLRQGIAPGIFRREISTIISYMIDMHDAGITAPTAMAVLIMAITADPTLREVSTVVSAFIDLMEEEPPITEADALAIIAEAIAAAPRLRNFDDSIGGKYTENGRGYGPNTEKNRRDDENGSGYGPNAENNRRDDENGSGYNGRGDDY
ncbi:MAG TPA: hypothetical protein VLH18_04615 [Candidatus Limnocylindrales bacterium]|nr:hypothetical protein [Candidatus Limnocylindrales bacterium]